MTPIELTVWALRIPFVEAFRHSLADRDAGDAIVVRVRDRDGHEGFGEALARPYVTGETQSGAFDHVLGTLWPAIVGHTLDAVELDAIDAFVPRDPADPSSAAHNASRAALTLALLDCGLVGRGVGVASLLTPVREHVVYSGVITAGSPTTVVEHARRLKMVGMRAVKLKVGLPDDPARIAAAREILGPDVSLRLDANGAWDEERALEVLRSAAAWGVVSVEQPLPVGPVDRLAAFRRRSPVPIMVDESLCTVGDARALIAAGAADFFNVRISKCGGLGPAWEIVRLAHEAGVGVQIGCQVGETSILSAAGRHLAAAAPELAFAEGSFGDLLLVEDVVAAPLRFGHGGRGRVVGGTGLGVAVDPRRLERHAIATEQRGA